MTVQPASGQLDQFARDKTSYLIDLFTLNFDDLLESALREVLAESGRPSTAFPRGQQSLRAQADEYEVHHLHGFFGLASPTAETVILTTRAQLLTVEIT